MKRMFRKNSLLRSASLSALLAALATAAMPLAAQDNGAEARIRSMEAQIRALQRKVFPGDGKVFGPEIVTPAGVAAPAASGTAMLRQDREGRGIIQNHYLEGAEPLHSAISRGIVWCAR